MYLFFLISGSFRPVVDFPTPGPLTPRGQDLKTLRFHLWEKSECENGGAATNGMLGVTGSAQRCLTGYEMFPEGTGSLRCSAVGRVVTVTVRYLTLAQGP